MTKRTAKRKPRRKDASTRKKAPTRRKTSTRKKAPTRRKTSTRKAPAWMGPAPAVHNDRQFRLSRDRVRGVVRFLRRDRHDVDHYEMTIGTQAQPELSRLQLTEDEHGWFCTSCARLPLTIRQAALGYMKTLPRRKVT